VIESLVVRAVPLHKADFDERLGGAVGRNRAREGDRVKDDREGGARYLIVHLQSIYLWTSGCPREASGRLEQVHLQVRFKFTVKNASLWQGAHDNTANEHSTRQINTQKSTPWRGPKPALRTKRTGPTSRQ